MKFQFPPNLLSFHSKLFLSVILLFLSFATCFMAYQYHREKEFKVVQMDTELQAYNDKLYDWIEEQPQLDTVALDRYLKKKAHLELRITIINQQGVVIYDNVKRDALHLKNHHNRKEIAEALKKGKGHSISRHSETVGGNYFYSAKYYPDNQIIIRSARPYNVSLIQSLKADSHFVWFTLIVSVVLIVVFYRFTQKLGSYIKQLKLFAEQADQNEPMNPEQRKELPRNELGEISEHIIQIYQRLHKAKEELYIEREKLITHLSISHEGLGIFTQEKKEILVNTLFIQYFNFISDKNLSSSEELFSIPELKDICLFIEKKRVCTETDDNRYSIILRKNGRVFALTCIIFQDESFEISINDVTQEEEQARIKKQLTQNIAHELKTPVSSIHGYLETIVNNRDLPQERMLPFIDRCYAQCDRLTHLLRDISLLTRTEEASELILKERVNLQELMATVLEESADELKEKGVDAHNLLKKGLCVYGNHSLLYSIFRNLTDNAMAYAGTEIELVVKCFREDEQFYYFSFSDNGTGVPEEHLGRLFERFYRVDKGRSRKLGGTGLGLAIVKRAVLIHGGSIFAKNAPNGGLELIFTLSKTKPEKPEA